MKLEAVVQDLSEVWGTNGDDDDGVDGDRDLLEELESLL